MPAKLPYQKWVWADWFQDTRGLTAAARGVWIDTIGYLREHTRTGQAAYDPETWSRLLTVTPAEIESALPQLQKMHIAQIVYSEDGTICITCRRIAREKNRRIYQSQRKRLASQWTEGDGQVDTECTGSKRPQQSQRQKQEQPLPVGRGAKKPPARSGVKTAMPEGWTYNDTHRALAEQMGAQVQVEFVHFRDDRLSKGVRYANWDLAFLTWLRNTERFNPLKRLP